MKQEQGTGAPAGANIYFEFIANRFYFYLVSGFILFGTPIILWFRPLNLGLDFIGGAEFLYSFEQRVDEETVRGVFKREELKVMGDVIVQRLVSGPLTEGKAAGAYFLLRTKVNIEKERGIDERLDRALEGLDKGKVRRESTNKIGPVIGDMLKTNTYKAIVMSLVVILLYMTMRFEFRPGVACGISLVHDTFSVLLLFSITQYEVDLNVIAAILTVLGYSMNDSIVILDRLRENMRLRRKIPFPELVNLSINEALVRTLMTSLTTILVLLAIFIIGPVVLHGFSLALILGVVTGTFSTFAVVTPIYVDWYLWDSQRARPSKPA